MKRKHLGIMFVVFAVIYTLVEVAEGGFFNFFIPLALIGSGLMLVRGEKRNERIFGKKE
ncbi:hypothetical protein [Desmospora profundinema]|uniref:Uncharacterized protein n=1 Tax=Desmospora profundinema TaxID=1571184 RepID=A0ABU1IQJ6_9BACL|nr:hypothetical protein [Desmospora profundinema]MDR6227060.1 hypothetical protein [Desmospora profundinema]